MNREPDAPGLIFDWERSVRFRWKFFALVLCSAFVHLATFFLFQITYPPRVSIPPPAPEISLLLPTTEENRALLRRIEAEDPAITAANTGITPPTLLAPRYIASYETIRTQPRTVAIESTDARLQRYPAPRAPLDFIRGTQTPQRADVPAAPASTRVAFSSAIAARAPATPPAWTFSPRAAIPVEAATFLIGITDRGEVRYVFPQHPSGDPNLDAQAATQLSKLDFQHSDAPIAWGIATLTWGDDAYAENPPSDPRVPPSK